MASRRWFLQRPIFLFPRHLLRQRPTFRSVRFFMWSGISVENAGAAWNQTGGTVAESVATRSLRTIEPDKRILGCQTPI